MFRSLGHRGLLVTDANAGSEFAQYPSCLATASDLSYMCAAAASADRKLLVGEVVQFQCERVAAITVVTGYNVCGS